MRPNPKGKILFIPCDTPDSPRLIRHTCGQTAFFPSSESYNAERFRSQIRGIEGSNGTIRWGLGSCEVIRYCPWCSYRLPTTVKEAERDAEVTLQSSCEGSNSEFEGLIGS